jgi:hypothetical protein
MTWGLEPIAAIAAPLLVLLGAVLWVGRYMQRVDTAMTEIRATTAAIANVQRVQADTLLAMAAEKVRIDSLEKRFDELRHGEGFVLPLPWDRAGRSR